MRSQIKSRYLFTSLNSYTPLHSPVARSTNDHFWTWVGAKAKKRQPTTTTPKSQNFVTTMENGGIVLATLELKKNSLIFSVNARGRCERGRALLDKALAGLVREPLVES